MDARFEQLCLGHLPQLGLRPADKGQEAKNGVGFTFVPDPEIGEGYLWTYPINSACSLTVYDIIFYQDISFRCHHPAALTIAVSSPGSVEPVLTKSCHHPENLVGYFLEEGIFSHTIPKGTPVRSIGLGLMPEFWQEQLPNLLAQDTSQVFNAACALDGTATIPEVEWLLHQMASYVPTSKTAALRYEAKIFELISALLEWRMLSLPIPVNQRISATDQEVIQNLKHYLSQNYAAQMNLQSLAQMCYMSKSKMTALFRTIYGMTIYDFILNCRIERAKELLTDRRKKISEIALSVGYEHPSSFSVAFHQKTGLTPSAFRKQ
ncbi:MAG: AraC family transcriptional regulator [Peptococcaceae bacterium]|nr:AraC family transcriptional regulator [Peptococcaceae bacterium]